ncbi:MAG: hypothetical protein GY711_30270, partial [bacterium]|nr:hypothetical protein [bacterium]
MERHLPQSWDGRWRILLCDAFAPQGLESLKRLAWQRGFVLVQIGGGCTGTIQVNDTDLHQKLRHDYQQEEMRTAVEQMREDPTRVPSMRPADCIGVLADVWRDTALHERAAEGFSRVGLAIPLDGTGDWQIVREARLAWDALEMPRERAKACAAVAADFEAGRLDWTYEGVYSLVVPFESRGILDRLLDGQDGGDESDDACPRPWRDAEDSDDDDALDDPVLPLAGEGPEASTAAALPLCDGPSLNAEDAEDVERRAVRERGLREARDILAHVGEEGLLIAVDRAIHKHERAARSRGRVQPEVAQRQLQRSAATEAELAAKRRAAVAQDKRARDVQERAEKLKGEAERLKRAKGELQKARETYAAVAAYTLADFGDGRGKGGAAQPATARVAAVSRLARHGGAMAAYERDGWNFF